MAVTKEHSCVGQNVLHGSALKRSFRTNGPDYGEKVINTVYLIVYLQGQGQPSHPPSPSTLCNWTIKLYR